MDTINFSELLESADDLQGIFDDIPRDRYNLEVFSADAKTSSTGKPMIETQLRIYEGDFTNRRVFNYFVLSVDNSQALGIFFQDMNAFGLSEKYFRGLGNQNDLTAIAHALVGRKASALLDPYQYDSKTRYNVKFFRAVNQSSGPNTSVPLNKPLPTAPPSSDDIPF